MRGDMKAGGVDSFEAHYRAVYGARWEGLRQSLVQGAAKVWRWNGFCGASPTAREGGDVPTLGWAPDCWCVEPGAGDRSAGLETAYAMDPASVVVARALGVEAGMEVLDLCAAPGGKSLILAEALRERGRLVANDLSKARRYRLNAILDSYVPPTVRERIRVSGRDAATFGMRSEASFDRVLADVPCSAEGHLLGRPTELARWSVSRTKQLARRQYAILCSALLAVRSGGRIVYATCSLSPDENDGVVARLLKRKGEQVRIREHRPPLGSATEHGWQILPDREGAGPSYFAVLEKL